MSNGAVLIRQGVADRQVVVIPAAQVYALAIALGEAAFYTRKDFDGE